MRTAHPHVWIASLCLALSFLPASAFSANPEDPPVASVQATAEGVSWLPGVDYEALVLTVSQPDGAVIREEAAAGETPRFGLYDHNGQRRPDGVYVWEVRVTRPPSADSGSEASPSWAGQPGGAGLGSASRRLRVQSGTFALLGGALYLPGDLTEAEPGAPGRASRGGEPGLADRDQVVGDELIVQGRICVGFDCAGGEVFGDDVARLKENNLVLRLEDTSTMAGFPTNDWQLRSNDPSSGGPERFSIEDADGGTVPFTLEAGAPTDALRLDAQGRMGLGTATPAADLHLVRGDAPSLRLEQDGTLGEPLQSWELAGDEGALVVTDLTAGTTPLSVAATAPTDSLVVDVAGRVGMGTASPAAPLEVASAAGAGGVVVRETHPVVVKRTLLELFNNGAPAFYFHDTASGKSWQFSMSGIGSFQTSLVGSGGPEFELRTDGRVLMGPGAQAHFDLDPAGNLDLTGDLDVGGELTAQGCNCSSSGALKAGLVSVEGRAVLEQLARLPVSEWSFQTDPRGARHLGPTAEDFRAAFGLGRDSEHISALDASGVTMAALQGLHRMVQEQDARIEERDARIGELERRLVSLETALARRMRR